MSSEKQYTIELDSSKFHREYERSRQGNLRCFPHCHDEDKQHNTQSFCGSALHMFVKPLPEERVFVFGEFLPCDTPKKTVGTSFPEELQALLREGEEGAHYHVANRITSIHGDHDDGLCATYAIAPRRKWHLQVPKGRKDFVFVAYLVVNAKIHDVAVSSAFRVGASRRATPQSESAPSLSTFSSRTASSKSLVDEEANVKRTRLDSSEMLSPPYSQRPYAPTGTTSPHNAIPITMTNNTSSNDQREMARLQAHQAALSAARKHYRAELQTRLNPTYPPQPQQQDHPAFLPPHYQQQASFLAPTGYPMQAYTTSAFTQPVQQQQQQQPPSLNPNNGMMMMPMMNPAAPLPSSSMTGMYPQQQQMWRPSSVSSLLPAPKSAAAAAVASTSPSVVLRMTTC